jgi:hypothetical protein
MVLCRHTHSAAAVKISDNLEVKIGQAKYYQPMIQVISI